MRGGMPDIATCVGNSSEFVGACMAAFPRGEAISLTVREWKTRAGSVIKEPTPLTFEVVPTLIQFSSRDFVLGDVIGLAENVTRVRFEKRGKQMYLFVNEAELEAIRFIALTRQNM